ncbi:MAG: hypothetical protein QM601_06885 [Pseudoxanthomonas sp.]
MALLAAAAPAWAAPTAAAADAPLQFRIDEGGTANAFFQHGPVAAHLLATSGTRPRLLVAFPAGNSGVGAWFAPSAQPLHWTLGDLRADDALDDPALHGIVAELTLEGGALELQDAVLGSVRVLRDYQLGQAYPPQLAAPVQLQARRLLWQRPRLDGAPGYRLELELRDGRCVREHGRIRLLPDRPGAPLHLRLRAATGETPLTPFAGADALLTAQAGADARTRDALRFLSYHEKLLAGSWRFDTYFGRDTLMSVRLLMPVLQPAAIEAGLGAVLARLSPAGEVAHEEDIGEFAVLRHRQQDGTLSAAPLYDYKMIDDDFMLAPVAAAYLLDHAEGRARAFLARRLASGETAGAALARNFDFVVRCGRPFARAPAAAHLIALKPGQTVGQWRDSENGLAGGRYPYDVNAVWVPAALSAIARIQARGLLAPYADPRRQRAFAEAGALARAWSDHAPALFEVSLDRDQARARVRAYAARAGVDPAPALASLPDGPLRFAALALDAGMRPIPVLHSDVGFALLFGEPPAAAVEAMVTSALRPFPAGLLTDVGMVAADPAYADAPVQALFDRNAYHGTGVWSWQQAVMATGLRRQLERKDLPDATRARLRAAQARLWKAIAATWENRTSELWSWSFENGRYRVVPYGQGAGDADESNAAQLWSTVILALPLPPPSP